MIPHATLRNSMMSVTGLASTQGAEPMETTRVIDELEASRPSIGAPATCWKANSATRRRTPHAPHRRCLPVSIDLFRH